ncbi:MAG: endolytic transglycosylase MltG [Acidimicrobiales bacterium]
MTFLDQQDGENSAAADFDQRLADHSDLEWEDETEFVRARPPGIRMLRAVVAAVILAAIGFVIYSGGRTWFAAQLDPEGEPGAEVTLIVPSGSTTGTLASILESNEVIPNSTFFRYYAEWKDFDNFQAGEYTLQENMSADEAMAVINAGPKQIEYGEFLIPEGLWIEEILQRTAAQIPSVSRIQLQAALDSGQISPRYRPDGNASWEGLLFPAKYFIEDDITAPEVLAKMSNEFAAVTGELGYGGAERKHNLSAYEVIIIASLVEAEAKTDGDRGKIARVIYNRLNEGQPLGIDATLIYGKRVRGEPPTREELDTPGPYNTRHPESRGLPPTPIAAPGRKSLEAAMNPVEGPWLYYVRIDEEGNHAFEEEFEDHLENVAVARELGFLDS